MPLGDQIMLPPPIGPTAPLPAPPWRVVVTPTLVAMVLWATLILKLHNLDHTALTRWDEAFHAVVAQNVLKHPFKPTLIDLPYLPYDSKKWEENHIWLHKPILPFWQVALSFAVLGVNTFALRLPAVILSTGAAWFTYLIGKELFDRRTALLAATLQATNAFLVKLVHGFQFADNIDVALLFWVEVGIYFLTRGLRTGSWRDLLMAGVAQGLAFLCKSYLAGIIFGIALTAWLLPVCRLAKRDNRTIGPTRLLGLLGATLLTVGPWLAYCMINFPDEFWHEHAQVWRHLIADVEGWAAPWDRLVFDYMIAIYGFFYTPILVACVVLLGKALAHRHRGLWLSYAWVLGVLLPHLLAVSKTPSATVIALPAFLLLLAHFVAEASRRERWPLIALTAVLAISVIVPASIQEPGYGYPRSRVFAGVMLQSMWVIYHVAGALVIVTVMWSFTRIRPALVGGSLGRFVRGSALVFCLCVLARLGFQTVETAWRVTCAGVDDPLSVEVGRFARDNLPANAVLLCDERIGGVAGNLDRRYEHMTTMFFADRTCYALGSGPDQMARQVLQAGGIPFIVSHRKLSLPPVYVSPKQALTVYRWRQQ